MLCAVTAHGMYKETKNYKNVLEVAAFVRVKLDHLTANK
jgi:hypothetical protein